ncbi:class C sortase [Bariatricus sp. SGI.161]|uniref:class C sortase n=1 Tax=Bariatricus sp. SGI.161 TaxID=3420550 RepID=UPI003D012DF3
MRKHFSTVILIFVFLIGLSLLLYPSLSNYWNSFHASRAVASYSEEVANLDEEEYRKMLEAAKEYNRTLLGRGNQYTLSEEQKKEYNDLLNVGGTGIMGYIEIESLVVSLPIYHGTDDAVLQIGVGHLDWTSLPVGGEGTHCVISGHRGLPSAKLFTNLDKMSVGDTFVLRVLDEVLTYEVDQILIVEPDDTEALQIEQGKDLCTLVTCTPYGINTHRLLVRGHRVENAIASRLAHVTSDAVQIEPLIIASIIAVPLLLLLLIKLLIPKRRKK